MSMHSSETLLSLPTDLNVLNQHSGNAAEGVGRGGGVKIEPQVDTWSDVGKSQANNAVTIHAGQRIRLPGNRMMA